MLDSWSGGRSVRLLRRFDHGVGGTSLIELDGRVVVLKAWVAGVDVSSALSLMQIIIDKGVPVPQLLEHGRSGEHEYLIYAFVDGVWPDTVTSAVLRDMFTVIDAERGAAPTPNDRWRSELEQMLTVGDPRFDIDPDVVDAHPGGRALLAEARRRLDACPDEVLRAGDVVHADFAPENVLVRGDRLVGVVDWERCRVGDAGVDIAGAIFDIEIGDKADEDVRAALWAEARERMDARALALYVALYAVRYASWAIGGEMEDRVLGLGRRLVGLTADGSGRSSCHFHADTPPREGDK